MVCIVNKRILKVAKNFKDLKCHGTHERAQC